MILKLCLIASLINQWIQLIWLLAVCSYPCIQPSGGEIFLFHLYCSTAWLLLYIFFSSYLVHKISITEVEKGVVWFQFFLLFIFIIKKENVKRIYIYWVCDYFPSLGIFLAKILFTIKIGTYIYIYIYIYIHSLKM